MNIVLFLGAGFSAEFGFPVMNEFFGFADSGSILEDAEKNYLNELVLDARKANSFLQSSPTNLEDILSFAIMGEKLSILQNDNSQSSNNINIRRILQKIFLNRSENEMKYKSVEDFLGFHPNKSEHRLSIITTNYDLCAELSIKKLGMRSSPGFHYEQLNSNSRYPISGDNLYTQNGIPVYKLHGSVNWFKHPKNNSTFLVEGNMIRLEDIEYKNFYFPLICMDDYKCPDVPVIIPPSFLKPDMIGPLNSIWALAAKTLERANLLIFIGYSFPLSDTVMMYFFARSLVNNPNLRKISIIDPKAKEIEVKIKDQKSKFGSHFQELIEPMAKRWSEAVLSL